MAIERHLASAGTKLLLLLFIDYAEAAKQTYTHTIKR